MERLDGELVQEEERDQVEEAGDQAGDAVLGDAVDAGAVLHDPSRTAQRTYWSLGKGKPKVFPSQGGAGYRRDAQGHPLVLQGHAITSKGTEQLPCAFWGVSFINLVRIVA